jgi:hypothetical protein
VVDRVAFGLAALTTEIEAARLRHANVRAGLGARFFAVFRAVFDEISAEVDGIVEMGAVVEEKAVLNRKRSVARLLRSLREHDAMVAEYSADVGREDLPIGFSMLIDSICLDLFPHPVDPLVHVSNKWDYSLTPVGKGRAFILHLPAVDPTNVLLAPILVHELGHALFNNIVDEYNSTRANSAAALAEIAARFPQTSEEDQTEREKLLPIWAEELFCDAVATLITGPSYLLALTSRTVDAGWNLDQDHPPPQLRVEFILRILDEQGWMSHIRHRAPAIAEWAVDFSGEAPAGADNQLSFLWNAGKASTDGLIALARSVVPRVMEPGISARNVHQAARHFRHLVLPVDLPRTASTEWEFVLGAWLLALTDRGLWADSIPSVPFDTRLNGMVMKTIELSRIAELWDNDDFAR